MGHIQNLEDLICFLRRRGWLVAAVALLGAVIAGAFALSRPLYYEAAAAIQVQGPRVGTGAAAAGSAQVLQAIEQRLTTREALAEVIRRHALYAGLPALSQDEKIALLRASVTFEGVEAAGNPEWGNPAQIAAIIIHARDGDAETAARMANDFAQGVLDMSYSSQIDRANDTYAFHAEEVARLTDRIAALEARIADYRNANAAAAPPLAAAQGDELVGIEADIRALDRQLVALMEEQRQLSARGDLRVTEKRRLQEIDGQIAVLTEQKGVLARRRADLDAAIARLPEVERGLAGLERELRQLQDSLAAASARLTEAEAARRLAERQQGDRFALLDRAVTPEWPVGSSRRKIFAAGALASLMAGLALAFLLDMLHPVVRTSAQMERQLGLRPVIAIPDLDFAEGGAAGGGKGRGGRRKGPG